MLRRNNNPDPTTAPSPWEQNADHGR